MMNLHVNAEKIAALQRLFARLGIREEDLVEKFIRASGPGGQKVNKTASAVYLKHLPSGIEIKAQASRSQSLNRFNARRLLARRLEAQVLGKKSAEAARIAKVQRQKRKRSKRAKNKVMDDKSALGTKKRLRSKPQGDD